MNKRFPMWTVALAIGGLFLGGCALNGLSESEFDRASPDGHDEEFCTWIDGKLHCNGEEEDVGTAEDAIESDDPGVGCQSHPNACQIMNWPSRWP